MIENIVIHYYVEIVQKVEYCASSKYLENVLNLKDAAECSIKLTFWIKIQASLREEHRAFPLEMSFFIAL